MFFKKERAAQAKKFQEMYRSFTAEQGRLHHGALSRAFRVLTQVVLVTRLRYRHITRLRYRHMLEKLKFAAVRRAEVARQVQDSQVQLIYQIGAGYGSNYGWRIRQSCH